MLSGKTIAPWLQKKKVHEVPFLLHVYLLAAGSVTLFYLSFWTWEFLKLGMRLRDNTAQNTEACKTSCIWSSSKILVRGLYLGKKQKKIYPLMVKLVTDWEIFKGYWYTSPLQVNVWDRFLRCVAEVFLKAWPVSLSRAVQLCCMLICMYINSLEQDHMCSTWLSRLSHTLTLKIFSRKQLLRYHSFIFHIKKEMLMLVVCHSFVHILNDPTVSLNDGHRVCLSISQLLLPWFSFTVQIWIYLISFSFHFI